MVGVLSLVQLPMITQWNFPLYILLEHKLNPYCSICSTLWSNWFKTEIWKMSAYISWSNVPSGKISNSRPTCNRRGNLTSPYQLYPTSPHYFYSIEINVINQPIFLKWLDVARVQGSRIWYQAWKPQPTARELESARFSQFPPRISAFPFGDLPLTYKICFIEQSLWYVCKLLAHLL